MSPKVTVVIPAYNAMEYLPETVESVLRQSFSDFELLIVNDGSSDNIEEWAHAITDSRVNLISQENKGLSGARNAGILTAKGEYITFLDADDLWEPTKLEKQVDCLEKNIKIGLVYTWVNYFYRPEDIVSNGRKGPEIEGDIFEQILEKNFIMCGSNVMIRRTCFDEVGVFDESLSPAADWDMWIRIAAQYPFAVVKEVLVHYRQHNSSMSKNYVSMLSDFNKIFEKVFQSIRPDLLHLKEKSHGHAYLYLAWLAWESKDYKESNKFLNQAVFSHPKIKQDHSFEKLRRISTARKLFGPWGYSLIRILVNLSQNRKEFTS